MAGDEQTRTDEVLATIREKLDLRRAFVDELEDVSKITIVVRFKRGGHVRVATCSIEDGREDRTRH